VLTLQLQAYAAYHGAPGFEASTIRPGYVGAARDLYAGRIDFETFYARTTPKLADFMTEDFRAAIAAGRGAYWQILDASEAYRWRRVTPLRIWHGGADEVTPLTIARLPDQTQALLGGASTEAVDAGPKADHRAVFIRAVLDQKEWFDGLRR
jgi:hypothetical protein